MLNVITANKMLAARDEITARFAKDSSFRGYLGAAHAKPGTAEYQRGLDLALRVELKNLADSVNPPRAAEDRSDDKIAHLIRKCGYIAPVGLPTEVA